MIMRFVPTLVICGLVFGPLSGCESLPGDKKTQGAVIGGLGGAAAGAVIGKNNRLVGGLIGGALGAGGGYLIGSAMQKNDAKHRDEAFKASDRDRDNPPSTADVDRAKTADLNDDGFVTLNEVVAMEKAGLSDGEMIRRLEDTRQVFALSREQENYLRDRGVSENVVREMRSLNQEYDRARTAGDRYDDRYNNSNISRDHYND